MNPLIPSLLAVAFLYCSALPAAAEDIEVPKIKFQKSSKSGIDGGDKAKAQSLLGLQCARILNRKPDNPCTNSEMAAMGKEGEEGEKARQGNRLLKDVGEKFAHLDGCDEKGFGGKDPDTGDSYIGELCDGAKMDIMMFAGGATDPTANAGTIKFMRESIMSDCSLYNAAGDFYSKLKTFDLTYRPAPGEASGASIKGTASKNWANEASASVKATYGNDDPYLAMKVLALYGHDNKFNFLSLGSGGNACQLKVLDMIKPNANSDLYKDEAIGSPMGDSWKDAYSGFYDGCKSAAAANGWKVEHELCGEYTSAQTGSYHLIAAAYLQCACKARGKGFIAATINDLTAAAQKDVYMYAIKEYKVDAIKKKVIGRAMDEKGRTPAVDLLNKMWPDKYKAGMKPGEVEALDFDAVCKGVSGCGADHVAFAKAAFKMFAFEVSLRLRLHHLGILAGNAYCGSGASLSHTRCQ